MYPDVWDTESANTTTMSFRRCLCCVGSVYGLCGACYNSIWLQTPYNYKINVLK